MPKSKRAKVVHLTKATKKDRSHNEAIFTSIRDEAAVYSHIFVFSVENMRNTYLKDVRAQLQGSRIVFGKTKVMAKALGSTPEEEVLPGISGLSKYLKGSVGLLFTSQEPNTITEFFDNYSQVDFARAGVVATETFTVPEGVVYSRGGEIDASEDVPVAHSIESHLRRLGMPTKLVKGKVMLDSPHTICKEGDELNSNQTALLKTFGITMSEFHVNLLA